MRPLARSLAAFALVTAVAATALADTTPPPSGDKPQGASDQAATVVCRLQRTGCYGWCPIYDFTVYSDGDVAYHGDRFVKTRGTAHAHVDKRQLAELRAAFANASFFALRDQYTHYDATDSPSVIVTYHDGARAKTVTHYHGDLHAPAELAQLEDAIDRIVRIEKLIGTEKERESLGRDGRR